MRYGALTELPPGLPVPQDDGAAAHLPGMRLPPLALPATDGSAVDLAGLADRAVVFCYPRTGRPGEPPLVDEWDLIPGARGCTPQSCAFRDLHAEFRALGAQVFGLSTQSAEYQQEAADRLHLPFLLLSDARFEFASALCLPTFEAGGETLLKRLTLVACDGRIGKVFYPVFPPDKNADEVLSWLRQH